MQKRSILLQCLYINYIILTTVFLEVFTYILLIPFLYFNYKIVVSDIKTKKIPNKYLGLLLMLIPFWWGILFLWIAPEYLPGLSDINPLFFSIQILLTLVVSFALYYFWIWAAWDAKYLLVLSLFIPYIGVIPFIGNIALVTIAYLLGYFFWFWFGKILFNSQYRNSLFTNVRTDVTDTWNVYKQNKWWNTCRIIITFIIIFLIIFVSIRLARIYLFNSILENTQTLNMFSDIIQKYNIYLVLLLIWVFIWSLYICRTITMRIKKYISQTYSIDPARVSDILLWILIIVLMSFVSYQLINHFYEMSALLFRIFTLYLWIYVFIKIIIYSYKITFGIWECYYKNIIDLEEGDYIDKKDLISILWHEEDLTEKIKNEYIFWVSNSLTKDEVLNLKQAHLLITRIQKKNTPNFKAKNQIKLLSTSPYWSYIISGFIITIISSNLLIVKLLTLQSILKFFL